MNVKKIDSATLELLWHDADAREVLLRRIITERLVAGPAPALDDHIVATYFFALRSWSLEHAAREISFGPDNNLYVVSELTSAILRFGSAPSNVSSGVFRLDISLAARATAGYCA